MDIVVTCLTIVVHPCLPCQRVVYFCLNIVCKCHFAIVIIHVAKVIFVFLRMDHSIRSFFDREGLYVKCYYSLVAFKCMMNIDCNF